MAVTLIAGLTLVPAVVSLLGPRVFWPSKAWRREPTAARFAAIGRSLGRRPATYAIVSGLVLAVLAIGAFSYKPTFDLSSAGIPSTAESQTALKTLEEGLPPGATDPTVVLLHQPSGGALPASDVAAFGAKLKTLPGVGAVARPKLSAGFLRVSGLTGAIHYVADHRLLGHRERDQDGHQQGHRHHQGRERAGGSGLHSLTSVRLTERDGHPPF